MLAPSILIGVAAAVVIWAVLAYNSLVALRNEAHAAWSGIEIGLRRRHDLIPALVEVVGGYAGHEQRTLAAVTSARTQIGGVLGAGGAASDGGAPGAAALATIAVADLAMTGATAGLLGLREAYPDLKASENFSALATQLEETEDKLAGARSTYNFVVSRFNSKRGSIPTTFVAALGSFQDLPFYEIERATDRDVVTTSFSPGPEQQ